MSKARNAVIIIILCIIGAFSFKNGPKLGLNMPAPDDIKDAVAGGPARRRGPQLTLASGKSEDLRDAVAGFAVGTPNNGNTLGEIGDPPRGSGDGGFGPGANNNNNNPPYNPPPSLSPSGPQDEPNNSCEGYGPSVSQNECYDR
ncbi:MAG: hypothetical protein Q8T11_08090 [Elusimicrobiota bacterium]|nr:hypothetical protein [Elusimicrobiota bacterium]